MDVDGSGNVVHHIELTKIQFFVREDATWVELIISRVSVLASLQLLQSTVVDAYFLALTASLQHLCDN